MVITLNKNFLQRKNMSLLGKALLILLTLSACAAQKLETLIAIPQVIKWETPVEVMIIDKSENWLELENKFAIPATILKRYNKGMLLKAGQTLRIPAKKFHQVKLGETSIEIALKYGLTFSEVIYLNELNPPYRLLIGQKLKVIMVNPKELKKAFKLLLTWPIDGAVTKKFGQQENGKYNNEISLLENGEVRASADGKVVYTGNEVGNYGNLIIIQHKGDWFTSYGNLSEITIRKGESVKSNQVIGTINNRALYFGLRDGTTPVDPIKYLSKNSKRKN